MISHGRQNLLPSERCFRSVGAEASALGLQYDMPPSRKGSVLRGLQVDLESDVPVVEQIMASLRKNSVRVMDLFREWDEDGDGVITKKEFCHSMPRLGIVAPSREFELLFDTFDPDGSGAIDMKELQKGLRPKPATRSPSPTKELAKKAAAKPPTLQEKMLDELKKTLQKKMRVLQLLFKEWDEDGSTAWSIAPLGSAHSQLLRLRRARLAALGDPALPGGGAGPLTAANHCLEFSS